MSLKVSERIEGDVVIVYLSGRVDSANAETLSTRLTNSVVKGARAVIVDLTELMFITSAGFRSLLLAHREAENAKRAFAISGVRNDLEELFSVTGFTRLFKIFDKPEDAIAQL